MNIFFRDTFFVPLKNVYILILYYYLFYSILKELKKFFSLSAHVYDPTSGKEMTTLLYFWRARCLTLQFWLLVGYWKFSVRLSTALFFCGERALLLCKGYCLSILRLHICVFFFFFCNATICCTYEILNVLVHVFLSVRIFGLLSSSLLFFFFWAFRSLYPPAFFRCPLFIWAWKWFNPGNHF